MNQSAPVGEDAHRTEDQSEVEAFLADPATHGDFPVERIETHAAIVFLAGDAAYKIKKAVRYAFLDFSTLEKRRAVCQRELERGRSMAPSIYRRTVAVRRATDGGLTLEGDGEPVEWCVEMLRFDQRDLLSEVAKAGGISDPMARDLGYMAAAMHRRAEPREGGAATVAGVIDRTIAPTLGETRDVFASDRVERLLAGMQAALGRLTPLLDRRGESGLVRLCHGDLHLANIVLVDGAPTPFDAIEFDDQLATTDVLYDLAFLLMDLWERGLRRAANIVLTRYLERADDHAGLAALPLFLAMRAGIRAMVTAMHGREGEAHAYFDWAERFIAPPPARLVAVGGLSGAGKSTLAQTLAPDIGPAPGAVLLRSDVLRKVMAGVAETTRLGPGSYTTAASQALYAKLREQAAVVLGAGHGAIVDAVHAREDERDAIAAVAEAAGAPFAGLWLDAPPEILTGRLAGRRGDASDANATVVKRQLTYDLGTIGWARLDAAAGTDELVAGARAALGLDGSHSGAT